MHKGLILIGACVALAGCGGGGGSEESADTTAGSGSATQQSVTVSETEFSLTPSTLTIDRPGTVAVTVKNTGQIAHALEIEGNGIEEETEDIDPGQSATLTVRLSKAGSYEMYCPIDGHEDKGMKGAIRVGGSSGSGTDTTGGTTTDEDDDKGGSGY